MLQSRIEELGSGILNYTINNTVHVLGFMSDERLEDYYYRHNDCRFSEGIYAPRNLEWSKIKDDALFIEIKDGEELARHQFRVIQKETIKFKDKITKKPRSKTYTIRKCEYTNIYNFTARETIWVGDEKTSEEENFIFNTDIELKRFFYESFKIELDI